MMELYQITEFTAVLINTVEYGSMCAEFDPGPSDDDPFPEYYNCAVSVKLINDRKGTMTELDYAGMKELYKKIETKSLRISYWRNMKYIDYTETYGGTGDCNPIQKKEVENVG